MAFHFTARHEVNVRRYLADYGDDCGATYNAVINEDEADELISNPAGAIQVGQYFRQLLGFYEIHRGLVFYDLSDLSPSEAVEKAILTSKSVWVDKAVSIYIYDGTGLTGVKADYGAIGGLTGTLGSGFIPNVGNDDNYTFNIEFNSDGLEFLESKAGGIAKIAFKLSTEGTPPGECPDTNGTEIVYLSQFSYLNKLHINSESGYIWVEGTKLAYLDGNYIKRTKEGTTTAVTGKIAGQYGIKPNDTYLRYIDNTGAERIIQGNLYASQGKIPGQIGIRSDLPSYLRYIDGYGDERSFMGDIPS